MALSGLDHCVRLWRWWRSQPDLIANPPSAEFAALPWIEQVRLQNEEWDRWEKNRPQMIQSLQMITIIAGSRPPKDIRSKPAKLKEWYESHRRYVAFAMADSGIEPTRVVSGCAVGFDVLGEEWAAERGIPVDRFPADWINRKTGRINYNAGKERNLVMIANAQALVAIWDGVSSGTKHCHDNALLRGLKVYLYKYQEA